MKLLVARIIIGLTSLSGLLMLGVILWLYWLPIIAVTGAGFIVLGIPMSVMWAYDTVEEHRLERGNQLWGQKKN